MNAENKIWDDTILPFQLDNAHLRGRVARLDQTLEQILEQHNYPAQIETLISEAVTLVALIGQMIKLRWKLSLQLRGSGAVRLIAVDYIAPSAENGAAKMRAYASFDADTLDPDQPAYDQLGSGYFALLMDQGQGTTPYQGITPLEAKNLASCAESYFAHSEQLPTKIILKTGRSSEAGASSHPRSGGLLLQYLPQPGEAVTSTEESKQLLNALDVLPDAMEEHWSRAVMLAETVEDLELIGPFVASDQLLLRLFHEEAPRIFPTQNIEFHCGCSAEKVRETLSIYSAKDIAHMTTDEGIVTADCQFCGAHYEFQPETLGFEATAHS